MYYPQPLGSRLESPFYFYTINLHIKKGGVMNNVSTQSLEDFNELELLLDEYGDLFTREEILALVDKAYKSEE